MTPAKRKLRAKARRAETQTRAKVAYNLVVSSTGVNRIGIEGRDTNASARMSDSASLRALLKFGKRIWPLLLAAEKEMQRRYEDAKLAREIERVSAAIREGMKAKTLSCDDEDIEDEVYARVLMLKMKRSR